MQFMLPSLRITRHSGNMSSRENATPPALQTLFKRVPSIRERTRRGSLGQVSGAIAIHDAVAKGKIHLAKFILDAVEGQSLVDAQDVHGKTPLIRATRIKDAEVRNKVVDLLLSYKANVNLLDHVGRSALSYACELHCNGVIRKLVRNNVDPNVEDHNGNTPLMYCAMANNAEAIEIISRSFRRLGLEVDKVNADAMTPLMEAAKNGYVECARLLAREAKASVIVRDVVRNMNAADWAREGGCSTPEVDILLPKQRTSKQSALNTAIHEHTKKSSATNGTLTSQKDGHTAASVELTQHSPTTSSRGSVPAGLFTSKKGNARKHPSSMEELSCRSKEMQSLGMPANRSSFPDVQRAGMQHNTVQEHHQFPHLSNDAQENLMVLSKGSASAASRGGLFTKRPQPPAAPIRPCSAAAQRPKRGVRHPSHTSTSVEDLLLMGDPTEPLIGLSQSPLKSSSMSHLMYERADASGMISPRFVKRSIGSDTLIDLTIVSLRELSGRPRTSSQPLPSTDPGLTSDRLESVSCTHLPPITPKYDQ
ncbi:ankycorbin-like [Patiria miniata]|uniref:Uncharacterized protein n=1 Tax=Patiria miniata TaxID=46514 RepID=A0A914B5M8_PATMI|nr:ankycorbin-like [Patiria miniata]